MSIRGVWAVASLSMTACSPALVVEESKFTQGEEILCEHVTTTGSHMVRRVCTTRAEREEQTAQAKAGLNRALEEQRARAMMDRRRRP